MNIFLLLDRDDYHKNIDSELRNYYSNLFKTKQSKWFSSPPFRLNSNLNCTKWFDICETIPFYNDDDDDSLIYFVLNLFCFVFEFDFLVNSWFSIIIDDDNNLKNFLLFSEIGLKIWISCTVASHW